MFSGVLLKFLQCSKETWNIHQFSMVSVDRSPTGKLLAICQLRGFSSDLRFSASRVDALTPCDMASFRSNASRACRNSAMVVGSGSSWGSVSSVTSSSRGVPMVGMASISKRGMIVG